jgi:hypothetical protein
MFNIWYLSPTPPPLPLLMTGPLDMHVAQWCMRPYNYYLQTPDHRRRKSGINSGT